MNRIKNNETKFVTIKKGDRIISVFPIYTFVLLVLKNITYYFLFIFSIIISILRHFKCTLYFVTLEDNIAVQRKRLLCGFVFSMRHLCLRFTTKGIRTKIDKSSMTFLYLF